MSKQETKLEWFYRVVIPKATSVGAAVVAVEGFTLLSNGVDIWCGEPFLPVMGEHSFAKVIGVNKNDIRFFFCLR